MPHILFENESKGNWGREWSGVGVRPNVSTEELIFGCLQRIAKSMERIEKLILNLDPDVRKRKRLIENRIEEYKANCERQRRVTRESRIIEGDEGALDESIKSAKFNTRASNILRRLQITTFRDLAKTTEDELMESKGCGPIVIQHIKDKMHERGMKLWGEA